MRGPWRLGFTPSIEGAWIFQTPTMSAVMIGTDYPTYTRVASPCLQSVSRPCSDLRPHPAPRTPPPAPGYCRHDSRTFSAYVRRRAFVSSSAAPAVVAYVWMPNVRTLAHSHLLAGAQVSGVSGLWPKVGAFQSVVLQLLDVGRHLDELHIGARRTTNLELLHPIFYGLQVRARGIQIFLFTREC